MQLPTPAPLRDAETNFVWVVVPFSRPENLEHVLANFRRQKFPFKKLVLVCNGRAHRIGSDEARLLASWDALILTSDAHQSTAKNTALSEIRKRGGGFTVVMDDDDWYGPHYLTEAAGFAKTYDIIGKSRHFVSVDGSLWLCQREQRSRQVGWLTGGTIACWAETAPQYAPVSFGEDAEFCEAGRRQGMKIFGTDLYQYLYRRDSTSDHAWRFSSEELRTYESRRGALDLGAEDLQVVCGGKLDVHAERLGARQDADTLAPPAPGGQFVTT